MLQQSEPIQLQLDLPRCACGTYTDQLTDGRCQRRVG